MKINYRTNNKLIISSSAILTGTLMVTTLASCTYKNTNDVSNASSNNNVTIESTNNSVDDSLNTSEPSQTENYDFVWEFDETIAFEKYVNKKFNVSITSYVMCFGFTEEFQQAYTDFVNSRYGKTFKKAPLKRANYFFDYLNSDIKTRHNYHEFKRFETISLDDTYCMNSAFNNKLIISYLIQNNIRLGEHIDINNLKSIIGNEVYTYDIQCKNLISNEKMGNYEYSHKYTGYDLVELLRQYNTKLYCLCIDESIKDADLLSNTEACEIYNKHLKQFYGENAFQLGMVPTREQYMAIYGEEPLDLSYIPGAIMKTNTKQMSSEEKTNDSVYSPVIPLVDQQTGQFYGYIDYPNNNVHYYQQDQSEEEQTVKHR